MTSIRTACYIIVVVLAVPLGAAAAAYITERGGDGDVITSYRTGLGREVRLRYDQAANSGAGAIQAWDVAAGATVSLGTAADAPAVRSFCEALP